MSCLLGHEDTPGKLSYTEHSHHFIYFCVICEDRICVGVLKQTGGEEKKQNLKDKASWLSKSFQGTNDKDTALIPLPLSNYKIHRGGKEGAVPALQLQSTSSQCAEFLLPLLSAGREHRIIPELEFAVNYSHSSPGF